MEFYKTDAKYSKMAMERIRHIEMNCPHTMPGNQGISFNMAVIDDEMLKRGRPYYQIYPEVFEAVSNTTLDLDIDDWKVPFDIFEIRMPKTDQPLIPIQPNSSIGITSIQVFRNFYKRMIVQDTGVGITYKYIKNTQPERLSLFTQLINHTAIKVNLCDYSDPQDYNKCQCIMTTLGYQPDTSIKDIVNATIRRLLNKTTFYNDEPDLEKMSGYAWSKTLKLALGVSLLATASQKMLEYDVLSNQLEAYREMNDKGDVSGCKNIEKKARKKGKFGWNIGKPRGRRLPLSEGDSYTNNSSQGGHHHCSSIRCGHWHKRRVGEGRIKVNIKWQHPTVVRPDLPAKESA